MNIRRIAAVIGAAVASGALIAGSGAAYAGSDQAHAETGAVHAETNAGYPAGTPSTYIVSQEPGVVPEGIEITPNGTIYVTGSGNGNLYRGHVRNATLTRFAPGADADRDYAAGVHADPRGRVFVAARGTLDVYDAEGRLIARRAATAGPVGDPWLNDLVITPRAVYVTDSTNAVVWRASLHGSRIGELERWLDVRSLVPQMPPQYFFLNGIDATRNGKTLIVASQGLQSLIRVDVASRDASLIDLGGASFGADGLVLRGNTVYAVLNYAAPQGQGVYVATLHDDLTTGEVVARVIDPSFDSPTTLALHKGRVYVVNSQLDRTPGTPPYTVSVIDDPLR